mmetsp:Transcript_2996/g.4627  ORF Transcript_2996/g.4627 Transcript_2996/m.4627 type:complete len:576 (-) Transcript_2996:78-1805(-)
MFLPRKFGRKYAVKVERDELRRPEASTRFVAALQNFIEEQKTSEEATIFEDFDISSSGVPLEQFKEICIALSDPRVQVERFRAFKCQAVGDEGALSLAEWLAKVSHDMAPAEMHLSDCSISTDGFNALMEAFDVNDAFPPRDPKSADREQKLPLYLRLECNLIEDAAFKVWFQRGVLSTFRKDDRRWPSNHKVRLLVGRDGGLNQKQSELPKDLRPSTPPRRQSTTPQRHCPYQDIRLKQGLLDDPATPPPREGPRHSEQDLTPPPQAAITPVVKECPWCHRTLPATMPAHACFCIYCGQRVKDRPQTFGGQAHPPSFPQLSGASARPLAIMDKRSDLPEASPWRNYSDQRNSWSRQQWTDYSEYHDSWQYSSRSHASKRSSQNRPVAREPKTIVILDIAPDQFDVTKSWIEERPGYLQSNPVPHRGCIFAAFTTNNLAQQALEEAWKLGYRSDFSKSNLHSRVDGGDRVDSSRGSGRALIRLERQRGTIRRWCSRQGYGWIDPAIQIDHPLAREHAGLVFCSKEDCVDAFDDLDSVIGQEVEYSVYSDVKGLGAQEVKWVFNRIDRQQGSAALP